MSKAETVKWKNVVCCAICGVRTEYEYPNDKPVKCSGTCGKVLIEVEKKGK